MPRLPRSPGLLRRMALICTFAIIGVIVPVAIGSAAAGTPGLLVLVPGDPAGWTTTPTRPILQAQDLGAGSIVKGSIGVRNSGSGPGILTVRVAGLIGTLARKVVLGIGPEGQPAVWHGPASDLEDALVVDKVLGAGESTTYTMTASLPSNLDNSEAGRATSFTLVVTLSSSGLMGAVVEGRSSIAVSAAGTGTVRTGHSSGLAFTGSAEMPLVVLAVIALLSGMALTVLERRSRMTARSEAES